MGQSPTPVRGTRTEGQRDRGRTREAPGGTLSATHPARSPARREEQQSFLLSCRRVRTEGAGIQVINNRY